MTDLAWLQTLKVDDKVIVCTPWNTSVGIVERLTATQILVKNHGRFQKKTGYSTGRGTWDSSYLVMHTKDREQSISVSHTRDCVYGLLRRITRSMLDMIEMDECEVWLQRLEALRQQALPEAADGDDVRHSAAPKQNEE